MPLYSHPFGEFLSNDAYNGADTPVSARASESSSTQSSQCRCYHGPRETNVICQVIPAFPDRAP